MKTVEWEVELEERMAAVMERVRAGIELLDRKKPGWREKIDCENLDLGDIDSCILGQVFRIETGDDDVIPPAGYMTGLIELQIPNEAAAMYGFETYDESYEFLQQAWESEVC